MLPGVSVEGVLVLGFLGLVAFFGVFGIGLVLALVRLIGGLQGDRPKRRHHSSGFMDGGTNWPTDYGSHSGGGHSSHSSDCGGHDGVSAGDCGGSDGGGCGGGCGGGGD